jgi:hypothetical protein
MLVACGAGSTAPEPEGPVDECGPYQPTDQDVARLLAFGKAIFAPGEWIRSYTVEPYKISLTRRNEALSAVSYTEYLIFTCGYGQKELDDYFGEEGFNIVFADYDSHSLSKFCEQTSLTLYEYDLVDDGANLSGRYWVKQDTGTRILSSMLVFPQSNLAGLDEYSRKLFPELAACP